MPGGSDKPMDVFGPQWDRHFLRISENWRNTVGEDDIVLIPGDISWAMQLKDAIPDLEEISRLPGRKILCKGNHEYWWGGISRVRAALPEGMTALQHDAADIGPCVVCGTRGWTFPTERVPLEAEDRKILAREVQRLNMALDDAERIAPDKPILVMMHFPPLLLTDRKTVFTEVLEARKNVAAVVSGHLHGAACGNGFGGEQHGIRYYPVSCDAIGFCPAEIPWPVKS